MTTEAALARILTELEGDETIRDMKNLLRAEAIINALEREGYIIIPPDDGSSGPGETNGFKCLDGDWEPGTGSRD